MNIFQELPTVIGLIAASLTTIAYLPQAWQVIKTRHTKDLSLGMYTIMTSGVALWLTYGILIGNLPIIVANCITIVFTTIILAMKIRYR